MSDEKKEGLRFLVNPLIDYIKKRWPYPVVLCEERRKDEVWTFRVISCGTRVCEIVMFDRPWFVSYPFFRNTMREEAESFHKLGEVLDCEVFRNSYSIAA